jgi:hypothetical protein
VDSGLLGGLAAVAAVVVIALVMRAWRLSEPQMPVTRAPEPPRP